MLRAQCRRLRILKWSMIFVLVRRGGNNVLALLLHVVYHNNCYGCYLLLHVLLLLLQHTLPLFR